MSRFVGLTLAFAFLGVLTSCSTVGSFSSGGAADYRSWLESRVRTERLYDRGKQLFAAKLLVVDDELKTRQEEISPGFSIERRPPAKQLVVAVTAFSRRELSPLDIVWKLGGREPARTSEVKTSAVHERLYPYAYPFFRVFALDFDAGASGEFEIFTPYGRLSFGALE